MGFPWDEWVPGALNKPQMSKLLQGGFITCGSSEPALDHSSMDLTLTDEVYEMLKGSVKPSEIGYEWFITKSKLAKRLPASFPDGSFKLEKTKTYVVRLREKLDARLRKAGVIHGQATAKSSVGRVDVLARLIVDGMTTYECFDPTGLQNGSGEMFLEITPITFDVKVKEGISLSQLRFFYGSPREVVINSLPLFNTIFRDPEHKDESLTVNLSEATIGDPKATPCSGIAFRSKARSEKREPVPLWTVDDKPDPCAYWNIEVADDERLYIEQDVFYILRSKEKLCVPSGIAIYCRASDETMGEMRIHYAGFVRPYFGLFRGDGKKGTPLIFEVRGHQVPVSLADKEKMANLIFYRMSQDAPDLTEEEKTKEAKGYSSQDLKLSKFFAEWPENMKRNADGTVEAIR
jgi:dCTP deaminase